MIRMMKMKKNLKTAVLHHHCQFYIKFVSGEMEFFSMRKIK